MDEIEARLREALEDPEFRERAKADPEGAIKSLLAEGDLSDDDLEVVSGGSRPNVQNLNQLFNLCSKLLKGPVPTIPADGK